MPNPQQIIAALHEDRRHDLLILAVPSHDRDNRELNDQRQWADAAMEKFSELYGGATALETFAGIWWDQKRKRHLKDKPILIESYADRKDVVDPSKLRTLLEFVRRIRESMRQESVMLVINDYRWYFE